MADTAEETVDTASETLVLSEQEKAELTEFVASQMFSNLQFNHVFAPKTRCLVGPPFNKAQLKFRRFPRRPLNKIGFFFFFKQ